jgi:hypothetical protein
MPSGTYEEHLRRRGVSDAEVQKRRMLIGDFGRFLESAGGKDIHTAGKPEAEKFARRLIGEGRNTIENFSALAEHAEWAGGRGLHVAWIELADCHNALDVLAAEIERGHGGEVRERIFTGPPPPLGADEKERGRYTREIADRMARLIPEEQVRRAWFHVQHGIPAEHWIRGEAEDREKFRRSGGIDAFLDLKRRERDALLTRLRDENRLWYTVAITAEVLEYVMSDPAMEVGSRTGENIFISKIPYNAVRYLREVDPRMKRYYACHCPLVRQAILDGMPIPPDVCHCSLGHASHYLAGIGRPYRGEVLESALWGDFRCRFVFRPVPEGAAAEDIPPAPPARPR